MKVDYVFSCNNTTEESQMCDRLRAAMGCAFVLALLMFEGRNTSAFTLIGVMSYVRCTSLNRF